MDENEIRAAVKSALLDAAVSVSKEEGGVKAGVEVGVTPQTGALASGAAGAMAYNWAVTVLGPWTAPALVVVAGGVYLYQRQQAKKRQQKEGGSVT